MTIAATPVPLSEAKTHLSELARRVRQQHERITLTRNGEPEHARIRQQEKPVPSKREKDPVEKLETPAKQEVLQFEPVTRGRFEKSEPTIIEGEDLDVPTYLRKHVKVK